MARGTAGAVVLMMLLSWMPGSVARAAEERSPEQDAKTLLSAADAAFKQGKQLEAVALAGQAISADPKNPKGYALRGQFHETLREHARAIADFDAALKLDPKAALLYQHRGTEHFRAGNFKQSVADFDKFIELVPAQAAQHWQRGISCYYAGMYEEGRKQFELHQSVNPQDVENAVWHFLCVTRAASVTKARASLIPITGDARVPMAQVQALFAGKATPEEVLAAARAGGPAKERLNDQLFYAHLYLGLFHDATGEKEKAREHILRAATEFTSDHYMGDVARVHAALLKARDAGRAK